MNTEPGSEEDVVCSPAECSDDCLSLENHQRLVYRAGPTRLDFVCSFSVKKRKRSSSMMTMGRQIKIVTRKTLMKR